LPENNNDSSSDWLATMEGWKTADNIKAIMVDAKPPLLGSHCMGSPFLPQRLLYLDGLPAMHRNNPLK